MSDLRILTVQDISCVGQCSLTVALPILSACGIETAILPSAVLSTHTAGFSGYTVRDLTDDMPAIAAHWKKEGLDGMLGDVPALGGVVIAPVVEEEVVEEAAAGRRPAVPAHFLGEAVAAVGYIEAVVKTGAALVVDVQFQPLHRVRAEEILHVLEKFLIHSVNPFSKITPAQQPRRSKFPKSPRPVPGAACGPPAP